MMTATMAVTASVLLLTGVLLAACRSDSDESSASPVAAAWGDMLEVGVLYEYDLNIHCGTWALGKFNGLNWWAPADARSYFGGSPPPPAGWTVRNGSVRGLLKLVDDDLIEYRIVGTDVVIEYRPEPLSTICY